MPDAKLPSLLLPIGIFFWLFLPEMCPFPPI
jgi:hypothetical protein